MCKSQGQAQQKAMYGNHVQVKKEHPGMYVFCGQDPEKGHFVEQLE